MKYVAFLRGIMPQIKPIQKMENLRKIFEEEGFLEVKSFIASGNIIFTSAEADARKLETQIEKALKEKTGIETTTMLRSQQDLEKFIKSDPFKDQKLTPSLRPHVSFLKKGGEVTFVVDSTNSKTVLEMAKLEKQYNKGITTRTWNTVQRIGKILQG